MKNDGTTITKNKEARHYQLKVQSTEIRTFFES